LTLFQFHNYLKHLIMAERSKSHLKQEFRDGERPTGADFGDLIDSFICKIDDAVTIDANSNLTIPGGLNLADTAAGAAGTLRFNGGNVQVFDGGTWNNVGGAGGGGFTPASGGPNIAFGAGNVGIGNFVAPAVPTFKLDVVLGNNVGTADRAKFGNAVLANGNGGFASSAQFSHTDHSAGNTNFALRQGPAGDVNINAPANQPIMFSHGRLTPRLFIAPTGPVVVGNNAILPGALPTDVFQVNGGATKTVNGGVWSIISDGRYKKDVKNFDDGLDKLMQVRPVRFKYDGLPGAAAAIEQQEEVGIIAQEMQQVFPYMISGTPIADNAKPEKKDDVLVYHGNALTYVMVNAIQELAQRVKELEGQLDIANKEK
jgi:hypothetical protein